LGDSIVPVVYDQARFILDADVHRCWASVGSKPIVYKNGSKESISIGGAYSLTGEFFFYSMKWQVKEEVLWNIKLLRMKFPNMFLPTGASDMNATEECWRQTRKDITSNISCGNKEELFSHLRSYWERQPFKHNLLNYLDY